MFYWLVLILLFDFIDIVISWYSALLKLLIKREAHPIHSPSQFGLEVFDIPSLKLPSAHDLFPRLSQTFKPLS